MTLTFKQWCDRNGYLHTGHPDYESFERRANQYHDYLNGKAKEHNAQVRAEKGQG